MVCPLEYRADKMNKAMGSCALYAMFIEGGNVCVSPESLSHVMPFIEFRGPRIKLFLCVY